MNQILLSNGQCELIESALANQAGVYRKEAITALQRNELSTAQIKIEQIKQIEKLIGLLPVKI